MSSADFLPNPAKSFRLAEQSTCQAVSTRYRSSALVTCGTVPESQSLNALHKLVQIQLV